MQDSYFHIRSSTFPVIQEDLDECANPGTYGKSLVNHLQKQLEARHYEIAFTVAEDFGWWIEIKTPLAAPTHLVLRRSHEKEGIADFAIVMDRSPRKWSWRRFRWVDLGPFQAALASDVRKILTTDPAIEWIADHLDHYPDHRLNEPSVNPASNVHLKQPPLSD